MSSEFLKKKTPKPLTSQEVAPRAPHVLALTHTWHIPQQEMGKTPREPDGGEGEKAEAAGLFW